MLDSARRALSYRTSLRDLGPETRIVAGNTGDHPRVLQLLSRSSQASLAADFQSRLDEPSYEPSNRLLLLQGEKLLGHLCVSRQTAWFAGQRCPLAIFADFAMSPEHRTDDCEPVLLELAESIAAQEGAILGLVRTDRPQWLKQLGWSRFRGQGFSRANTRAILSHSSSDFRSIGQRSALGRRKRSKIEVRSWRHYELDGLRRVYQTASANQWGMLHRSEAAWQWLVGRKAEDQILIAVDCSCDKKPDYATDPNMVGYAVVRDSCIVEMMTLPGYSAVRAMLTRRVCRDAIDCDHHFVSLMTPATDPMHELLVTAGGSWISDATAAGGTWMTKLLAPDRWVERFYPLLHQRAREAGLLRPLQLGMVVAGHNYRLTLTRRCARWEAVARTRQDVCCDFSVLQDMLTSNLHLSDALEQGRLEVASSEISNTLATLFPPKLFWQSAFELLRL